MRVVDAMAQWFDVAGFRHYFGYAGGSLWPFMDALIDVPHIRGIQAKHESHAVHMADVYFRTTGEIAPIVVNKGPGLMNCAGGVASAMHDSVPLLVIAGSGSTHFLGKAGMQEMYYRGFEDAVGVFKPITKGAWLVVRPDQVIDVLNMALKVATSGRPGPVFVQIPYDIQQVEVQGDIEPPARRAASSRQRADSGSIQRVADLVREAERPLFLFGGGAARAQAGASARAVVEQLNVPFATTLPAKGLVSELHPLSLGAVGRSGTQSAAEASRAADLVIAVGARFSDNHTSNWREGRIYSTATTRIVQVDVDPAEVGRNYPVELGLISDGRLFLDDLKAATAGGAQGSGQHAAWVQHTRELHAKWVESIQPLITASTSPVHPARLVHEVGEAAGATGRVYVDVGDVIQYAEPYMTIRAENGWHLNSGMAEMGWASSGVIGAVAADPSRPAICITGDGAFNMVCNAVATAVEYDLPCVWVILNNVGFSIEAKGSGKAYQRIHPWTKFVRADTGEPYNPDYALLAQAFGGLGERVEHPDQLAPALSRALASRRPYIIDVVVDDTVPSYFVQGIDRAYPGEWAQSYPGYGRLTIA